VPQQFYPQAEPPDPVTCVVYVLVGLFILATIIFVGVKAFLETH
jgi:hypothetical protein